MLTGIAGLLPIDPIIRAFKFLKSQSSGWNYIEKPVSSMLQYNDYNEDGHPSVSGHKKIAEYILQCLKT